MDSVTVRNEPPYGGFYFTLFNCAQCNCELIDCVNYFWSGDSMVHDLLVLFSLASLAQGKTGKLDDIPYARAYAYCRPVNRQWLALYNAIHIAVFTAMSRAYSAAYGAIWRMYIHSVVILCALQLCDNCYCFSETRLCRYRLAL